MTPVEQEQITQLHYLRTKLAGALETAARNVDFPDVYPLCRDDVRVAEKNLTDFIEVMAGGGKEWESVSVVVNQCEACVGQGVCSCGNGIDG